MKSIKFYPREVIMTQNGFIFRFGENKNAHVAARLINLSPNSKAENSWFMYDLLSYKGRILIKEFESMKEAWKEWTE